MNSQTPKRPRNKARYQPSSAERQKAAQFLRKLTPTSMAHRQYLKLVDIFLEIARPMVGIVFDGAVTGFTIRRSKLFDNREYLVAFVDDYWLSAIAPDMNAICWWDEDEEGNQDNLLPAPPLVFVPDSKRRVRSNAFRATVEHEMVHVNQIIQGRFPRLILDPVDGGLIEYFVDCATSEYEANLVELVRWTDGFPIHFGISLDHWCVLRGYIQALERVMSVAYMELSEVETVRFLDTLKARFPELLQRIGASEDIIPWFVERLSPYVVKAMQNTAERYPAAADTPAYRGVVMWLGSNLSLSPASQLAGRA